MSNILPPYLSPGDTVGIICPSGYMDASKVQPCIDMLKSWGYQVKTGKTVGGESINYFSGDDDTRLEDLQDMLDDDRISAILFGRGGYGMSRIIDRLNFKRFRKSPKWILGYSDITLLHAHIFQNFGICTVHSPMAGAFQDAAKEDPYLASIQQLLAGRNARYTCDPHPLNRRGEAEGILMGGNLTLIAHAQGSASEFKTRDLILFLEDFGEYLYNVDRMLYQLERAGKLHKPAAIIIGGFTELKDTERPFGKPVYDIIRDVLAPYDYPVCYGFPVGHMKENLALKCGAEFRLKVGREKVVLEEK